jgi:hypothetical protein
MGSRKVSLMTEIISENESSNEGIPRPSIPFTSISTQVSTSQSSPSASSSAVSQNIDKSQRSPSASSSAVSQNIDKSNAQALSSHNISTAGSTTASYQVSAGMATSENDAQLNASRQSTYLESSHVMNRSNGSQQSSNPRMSMTERTTTGKVHITKK